MKQVPAVSIVLIVRTIPHIVCTNMLFLACVQYLIQFIWLKKNAVGIKSSL